MGLLTANIKRPSDGAIFLFDQSVGKVMDDYVDPEGKFTQQCIQVTRPDCTLTVDFRPDKNISRREVVILNGKCFQNQNAAHFGPYHIDIFEDGALIHAEDVGDLKINHWWQSRWRWQSAPRPVRHTAQELIAAKLLVPFTHLWTDAQAINWSTVKYKTMGNAGIKEFMPDTGGRYDIGIETEWVAQYLIYNAPGAEAGVFAVAETSGSVPMHFRDEITGAPLDLHQHQGFNCYWNNEGSPTFVKQTLNEWQHPEIQPPSPWTPDVNHYPSLTYVPFLLTGDPYLLEEMQFTINFMLMQLGGNGHGSNGYPLVAENQHRAIAWALRTIWEVCLAMDSAATYPNWLLPRAYFKALSDAYLEHFTNAYMNSTVAGVQRFRQVTTISGKGFQDQFIAQEFGIAVYSGKFPEWNAAYDWVRDYTIQITNGTSGWERQCCGPYHMQLGTLFPPDGMGAGPDYPYFSTYKECFDQWLTHIDAASGSAPKVVPRPWPNTTEWMIQGSLDYLAQTHLSLAIMVLNGKADALPCFAFVDPMFQHTGYMTAALSVGSGGVIVPPTPAPVPSPAPTPPPTQGTITPMSFTVNVGQHKTASVVWTDSAGTPQPLPAGHVTTWVATPSANLGLIPSADGLSCDVVGLIAGAVALTARVDASQDPSVVKNISAASQGTVTPVQVPLPPENTKGAVTVT